jgi:hypothetical protein
MNQEYVKIDDELFVDKNLDYVNKHYGRNLKAGQKVKTWKGIGIVLGWDELCLYQ